MQRNRVKYNEMDNFPEDYVKKTPFPVVSDADV